ncbi:hypothetical protein FGG08_003292 [Glutinoglossum americanum]|uniref:Uncharacterized protein n=1 Tax=Glutinoglossum americanum TaxID=1670608 RepID=A0A9P8L4V2_9PEZI|nr:hypothetical protein FGG08_003292 [Glutinoglossum americanum]
MAIDLVYGWQPSPNVRGTIDILWSCLFTIFLCTWSALHLNIRSPSENYWIYTLRKARWMVQTLTGPEFVVWFACGQRYEANLSVKMFQEIGCSEWTIRHGFYANMGGIRLKAPDFPPFPITARHLHYLVDQGYTTFPKISMEEVWDKSKADLFTKTLVCVQICWQVMQVVARFVQNLPVTSLELTTLSYVVCALAMYFMWLDKPLDVETPTIIEIETTIKDILVRAGPAAAQPYEQSPLDFVDNLAPCWWINVQKYLFFRVDPRERPMQRLTNDKFPMVGVGFEIFYYAMVAHGFAGIHVAGWNFDFPTPLEKILWRAASLTICGLMVVISFLEGASDWHRRNRGLSLRTWLFRDNLDSLDRRPSREDAMAHPDFVPYWEFLAFVPTTLVYSAARLYLMLEVFLELRALPRRAYLSVQWTNFIPHV